VLWQPRSDNVSWASSPAVDRGTRLWHDGEVDYEELKALNLPTGNAG